jgi:hypothetical protein
MKTLSKNNINCSTKYAKYTKHIKYTKHSIKYAIKYGALCAISSLCFACGVRGDLVLKTAINQSSATINSQKTSK